MRPAAPKVSAAPNPANQYFTLTFKGGSHMPLCVRITYMVGKMVEERKGIAPGTRLEVGGKYSAGVYVAEVIQGNERMVLKLV